MKIQQEVSEPGEQREAVYNIFIAATATVGAVESRKARRRDWLLRTGTSYSTPVLQSA
jgi:hypothetical protein